MFWSEISRHTHLRPRCVTGLWQTESGDTYDIGSNKDPSTSGCNSSAALVPAGEIVGHVHRPLPNVLGMMFSHGARRRLCACMCACFLYLRPSQLPDVNGDCFPAMTAADAQDEVRRVIHSLSMAYGYGDDDDIGNPMLRWFEAGIAAIAQSFASLCFRAFLCAYVTQSLK